MAGRRKPNRQRELPSWEVVAHVLRLPVDISLAEELVVHWRWLIEQRERITDRLAAARADDTDERAADFATAKLEVEPLEPHENAAEWKALLAQSWRSGARERIAAESHRLAMIDGAIEGLNTARDKRAALRILRWKWVLGVPEMSAAELRRRFLFNAHSAVVDWLSGAQRDGDLSAERIAAHEIHFIIPDDHSDGRQRTHQENRRRLLEVRGLEDVSEVLKLDGPWKAAILIVARLAQCGTTAVKDAVGREKQAGPGR